ncbi:MAG: PKD domain-containing protein [Flavobacteriales bacterium]|nr:PKD domain-containing protein [Flavobacteriales bacterium]
MILWLSPDTLVYRTGSSLANINDRVTQWHDISGNGHIFTNAGGAVRPRYVTYQGKNMLDFTGGDLLENNAIASAINGLTEFSIYVIIKSDDVTNNDKGFLDSENPDGADDVICMRYDASGANTGRTNLIKCGMQGNTANNQIESQSNTQTNQLQCLTLTWKQGEPINLYIDGVLNETSVNSISTAMSGVQKILLGKGPKDTGGGSGWDGRIGTVIFYNMKMPPDTVSLISGDLKSINSVQSGNWNNPTTWDCNCSPPNNAFVKIKNGHTVTLTRDEAVNNVTIESGGILDLSVNNYILSLRRNLTNYGTINANQGTIEFIGTSEQLLDGSGTSAFYNLTVNNNAGVRMTAGAATVQGTLDIQNGCFTTNNNIILLSNATGTARLAGLIGSACISGDITMQRYIDAGATDWRFISSPISGATLADMNDDFITSGFPGSDFPLWPTASNPWPSIYYYDETASGIQDNGFVAATNITNGMGVGQGIWVYSGDTIIGTQPFTIDITGPPNTGNISLPMTYTNSGMPSDDGWNMVGNPYPSTLDWDSPNITKTNINNAIYIWNPDLQQFGSYVGGIGTNGATNNIASSQAFWVQATAASPQVMVTESSKTATDGAFLKTTVVMPFRIKATNNTGSDEMAFHFDPNASNAFDPEFDAEKMTSVNPDLPSISSVLNGTDYSINQLPEQEITLPIRVTTGISGLHQIEIQNATALGHVSCLFLEDLFTGTTYDLNQVQSFTAYIYDTTSVPRYLLHIGAPFDINTTEISCNGNQDGTIAFTKNTSTPFDITWKDGSNNIIASKTQVFGDTLTNLTDDTYLIETTDAFCGNRSDSVVISQPNPITSYFTTTDTIMLGSNFAPVNLSLNAVDYTWDFGDGNTSTLFNPNHVYGQIGNYLVTLKASQNMNCFEDYTKLITVVHNITGINDLQESSTIKTWIDNDVLTIQLNKTAYQAVEIRNALGQVIYNELVHADQLSFDLNSLSAGMYIVRLTTPDNHSESIKIAYSK